MKYDDILTKLGEFGKYQKRVFVLLSFPCMSAGMFMMMVIVVLYTPQHRCKIPGLDNDSFAIQNGAHQQLVNVTIPKSSDPTLQYDRCHFNVIVDVNASQEYKSSRTILVKCDEWVYDKTVFYQSFTTQANLVCDDALKTSHIQMLCWFGVLCGDIVLGMLADMIGRKKALYLAFTSLLAASIGVTFTKTFYPFAILQFIIGGSVHGAFLCIAVLSLEIVGPSTRVVTGMLIQAFFSVGVMILALLGFLIRSWRWITLATALPCIGYMTYWWFISESPRWLLSKGRKKETRAVIEKTARINGAKISEDMLDIEFDTTGSEGRIWHIFKSRVLLSRWLILSFNWMIVSMTYYGVTMNAGNMAGDFYFNFFLMGLAEFPGVIIGMFVLNRIGRRWTNAGSMLIGGIACLATVPTVILGPIKLQALTAVLAFIGKAGASAAFAIVYIFTAELLPTVVRNAAMGSSSCGARIGAMLAPYIAKSGELIGGNFGKAEPLLIFGTLSIIAGLMLLILPETLNQKLPDTIEEGEQFGRKNKRKAVEDIDIPMIAKDNGD